MNPTDLEDDDTDDLECSYNDAPQTKLGTRTTTGSNDMNKNKEFVAVICAVILASIYLIEAQVLASMDVFVQEHEEDNERADCIHRTRRSIATIFNELGSTYVKRAYRMGKTTFYELHRLLFPYLRYHTYPPAGSQKMHRNGASNGLVSSTIRLAVALRYFAAGGASYDLAVMHGISTTEVYRSVWIVVDAINKCIQLQIQFPEDHVEQRRLALGFRERSDAGFDCCVAAIDGILIWIERPNRADCERANCGPKKFMCGRKKKFGLNMMGTVDYLGRFLDVEITHPGSTSDYLAFATSYLKAKLEQPGFLSPGLVIFGDNAYSNSEFMVTPFKGTSSAEAAVAADKDNFNFYHSQLRIQVECAFGKLVHRWGILRRPIHNNIGIKKTCSLVMALCRLHNFCIDAGASRDEPLAIDSALTAMNSGIEFIPTEGNDLNPSGLLHGGEHFDDVSRDIRRRGQRTVRAATTVLPQQRLHDSVANQGLRRPTPKSW
jgi:DDE superfamily endonuclease